MRTLSGKVGRQLLLAWMLGAWGLAASTAFAANSEDVVWLRTGERVRGELTGMTNSGWFRWRHPFIQEEMAVAVSNVLKIRFGQREQAAKSMEKPCLLRLINGDSLKGELVGFDGSHLFLDHPACGRLSIPRGIIDGLQPMEMNARIVYQGPTGLEGWTLGQGVAGVESNAWVYGNGTFIALRPGSLARDVKLPDTAEISFQLEWEGYTTLAIALYADKLQPIPLAAKDDAPDFGGFYSLQLTLAGFFNAVLMPVKKGIPLLPQGLGYVMGQQIAQDSRAHFMIRANKKERTVYLYLNGELLRRWQDPMETLGSGTAMRLVNQGPGILRLSQLVVKEWDGRTTLQTNLITQGPNDLVLLLNQDRVSGVLGVLRQKEWDINTPLGPVQVPLSRIEQVHFSRVGRQTSIPNLPLARAAFHNQDQLGVHIEQWNQGRLTALHPLLGRLEIQTAALRELVLD